jgi:multidrug resistance efflux pump
MALQPQPGGESPGKALTDLAELRRFTGAPKDFWPRLLAALAVLGGASKAVLLLKDAASGRWKTIGDWAENSGSSRLVQAFTGQLDSLAAACETNGETLVSLDGASSGRASGHFALGIKQRLLTDQSCLAAFLLSEFSPAAAHEAQVRLQLMADVPRSWQEFLAGEQAKSDITSFAKTLDLLAEVNTRTRFLAAALAFCNGLSTSLGCDRVSLGWLTGGYVRLLAISRTEKFNRRMAAAQALEAAMDECLDQDEELLWPAPAEGQNVVSRDHEKYSREQNIPHLCSIPLRLEGKPVAVLTSERAVGPFTPLEVQQLRLGCDHAARRLSELQRHDRWFGARWAAWSKEQFALMVGPKHTWAKVISLLVVALLAVLFFVRVPYRVEGNFILKSDEVQSRTAPFDGYIQQVFVRPGDIVKANDKLVQLNTRELELEESASLADLGRYQREAEKARATNGLAEMRVALALADQSKARLDLVRHRLNEATIQSPLNGVVVEGDLRERLAAPVKQGDLLMKIARIENLYVEAEVNERDVHEILTKQRGEIAFVSQPKFTFPVRILKIEPAAISKADGNMFLVRCELEQGVEPWWRPGMSGLCKLSVEKRTLWWILTHRTVDFLRLKLWW